MCNLLLFLPLSVRGKWITSISKFGNKVFFLRVLYSSNPQPNDPTFVPLNIPDLQVAEQFSGQSVVSPACGEKNQL